MAGVALVAVETWIRRGLRELLGDLDDVERLQFGDAVAMKTQPTPALRAGFLRELDALGKLDGDPDS